MLLLVFAGILLDPIPKEKKMYESYVKSPFLEKGRWVQPGNRHG
jgi:hypothetical protein